MVPNVLTTVFYCSGRLSWRVGTSKKEDGVGPMVELEGLKGVGGFREP